MADDDVDFSEPFPAGDDDGDDMLYIDIQTVMKVLDEDDCDLRENSPEDSSSKNVSPSEFGIHDTFQIQNGSQVLEEPHFSRLDFVDSVTSCSPFCSDVSDSGAKVSVGFSDSAANSMLDRERENQGPHSQACSSPNAFPGNFSDSLSCGESDEICYVQHKSF